MTKPYGSQNNPERPPKKSKQVGKDFNAEFRGYINLNLSDGDKEQWSKFHDTPHVGAWFDSAVADGVNTSTKFEAKTNTFMSSGTQRRADSPNAGLVVTARGASATISFSRLMFILMLLSEHERWEDTQPVANPDRW